MNNNLFSRKNIIKQSPVLSYIRDDGADKEMHTHAHPELIFVAEGSGRFEAGEHQYPIKTGDLIICSKETEHSEYLFESSGNKIYHLGFTNIVLSGMGKDELIDDPFCIIHTQEDCASVLKSYFFALTSESADILPCSKIVTEDLLRLIIITSLRLAVSDMGLFYLQSKAFFDAKDFFDKNYATITNIEEVCENLHINKFYLTHIFKQQLGMPPIRYLQIKRMEKAKSLLATNLSISEIAERCGYSDKAYFCRAFKKVEQVSPLAYRRQLKSRSPLIERDPL